MNKKMILILTLISSALLLSSALLVIVYSKKGLEIPTEWYQAFPQTIIAEQWDWDWTNYQTSGPWATGGPSYALYKMVGDTLFLTYPFGPLIVAYRVWNNDTWAWSGATTGKGGPGGNMVLMNTATILITFTYEDIPETDEDNDYKGLRLISEMQQDLYRFVNIGDDNYIWQGWLHQHFISWATEGAKA